jgi:hypothetical protein
MSIDQHSAQVTVSGYCQRRHIAAIALQLQPPANQRLHDLLLQMKSFVPVMRGLSNQSTFFDSGPFFPGREIRDKIMKTTQVIVGQTLDQFRVPLAEYISPHARRLIVCIGRLLRLARFFVRVENSFDQCAVV